MKIVAAQPEHAKDIAHLLLMAMGDIVSKFLQKEDEEASFAFMLEMVNTPGSQYALENCSVALEEADVAGVICVYDGAHLATLRKPVARYVERETGKIFAPEDETAAGEIYIDCVAVSPEYRGRGIAGELLAYVKKDRSGSTLGLLVENPSAKRLYEKVGFKVMGVKLLMGKPLEHMQLS